MEAYIGPVFKELCAFATDAFQLWALGKVEDSAES
jgi:hypothetical protein